MAAKFLKLSSLCLVCLTLFALPVFAQNPSKKEIGAYVRSIDKLKNQKKLTKYFYPNKSYLGALRGFYSGEKLVYIEAIDGDYDSENRYFVYLKDDEIYLAVAKFYRYAKHKRRRASVLQKTEVSYPKDLPDSSLLEGIETAISDLKREKVLEK